MCEICEHTVCPPSCPNAEYSGKSCENCGGNIDKYDDYIYIGGYYFCEKCVDREMTARDLAEMIRPRKRQERIEIHEFLRN